MVGDTTHSGPHDHLEQHPPLKSQARALGSLDNISVPLCASQINEAEMYPNVTLPGGDCPRSFILNGRIGHTMCELSLAGGQGITPLEMPALRRAAYVHRLRGLGITINTKLEEHNGPYPCHHARCRLACDVTVGVLA
jgi:hypothetical protein